MPTARIEPVSVSSPAAHSEPFHLGYRPALDGLRAFAVLAVMAHHGWVPGFSGGAIGVDIFFVLSGFLITSLLIEEWRKTETISLRRFYLRRILRLIPALAVFLIAIQLYSLAVFRGPRLWQIEQSLASVVLYVANWMEAFDWVNLTVLSHTWSLSIEEQFYLLWPLAFLLLLRSRQSDRSILCLLGLAIATIAIWRLFLLTGLPSGDRIYFGSDTRSDELLAGCVLGVWVHSSTFPRDGVRSFAGYASVPAILWLVALIIHPLPMRVMYTLSWPLVELSVSVLILALLFGLAGPLQKILEYRPIVWVGRISYSLYLWHFPIIGRVVSLHFLGPFRIEVGFVLTFCAAAASYYFVELRFLKRKRQLASA